MTSVIWFAIAAVFFALGASAMAKAKSAATPEQARKLRVAAALTMAAGGALLLVGLVGIFQLGARS